MEHMYSVKLVAGLRSKQLESESVFWDTDRFRCYLLELTQRQGPQGFTATEHTGYWEGESEPSLSIETLCALGELEGTIATFRSIAARYNMFARQDATLVSWSLTNAEFATARVS